MVLAIEINQTNFAPAKITSLANILSIILPLLIIGASIFFLIFLFKAAFTILTAGDNKEAVAKAQKTLSFATLGLILVVSSFILVRVIGMILKVQFPL